MTLAEPGQEPAERVSWAVGPVEHSAVWAARVAPAPARIAARGDELTADAALRLVADGVGVLWTGDYRNARQLLAALGRRIDRDAPPAGVSPRDRFLRSRQARAKRSRLLGRLLVPVDAAGAVALPGGPGAGRALRRAGLLQPETSLLPLTELLGALGAEEWRERGVAVPALGARIYPHFGTFSPTRSEYLDLVATAPLPAGAARAFDIGTGTGVLAAILAGRGVAEVIGSDDEPGAIACANENLRRLGRFPAARAELGHLFPAGRADVIVCNPPWLPATPHSPLDRASYDPGSAMLRGFLAGLGEHLTPAGEGWLILSDLAELLELRGRDELLGWIEAAGLTVIGHLDASPSHARARDESDPLHEFRARETTRLWRLAAPGSNPNRA